MAMDGGPIQESWPIGKVAQVEDEVEVMTKCLAACQNNASLTRTKRATRLSHRWSGQDWNFTNSRSSRSLASTRDIHPWQSLEKESYNLEHGAAS